MPRVAGLLSLPYHTQSVSFTPIRRGALRERGALRPNQIERMLCVTDRLCATDRFSELLCAERSAKPAKTGGGKRPRRPISINLLDLEEVVQTGDLLLFSSRHAASNITKLFTNSSWDHVGIVVRPCRGFTFVVEWAGGIFASPIVERLSDYYRAQGRMICVRRLSPGQCGRRALQHNVETFIERAMAEGLGTGSPSMSEIANAVLAQLGRPAATSVSLQTDAHAEARQGLFCSKLIAATYKNAGLLSNERASADFLPKHFSSSYNGFLNLQRGAYLSDEIAISFEAPFEAPHTSLLNSAYSLAASTLSRASGSSTLRRQRAAALIGSTYRAVLARRKLGRQRDRRQDRPRVVTLCLGFLFGKCATFDDSKKQLALARRLRRRASSVLRPLAGEPESSPANKGVLALTMREPAREPVVSGFRMWDLSKDAEAVNGDEVASPGLRHLRRSASSSALTMARSGQMVRRSGSSSTLDRNAGSLEDLRSPHAAVQFPANASFTRKLSGDGLGTATLGLLSSWEYKV